MGPPHASLGTQPIKTFQDRKIASIDLGTHSALMLCAHRNERGQLRILGDFFETPRIGEGLAQTGLINEMAVARTRDVLMYFKTLALGMGITEIFLTASAALREAHNGEAVAQQITSQTGIPVEIISGKEEGRLSYVSVTFEDQHRHDPTLVLDLGGGSIEMAWGRGHHFDGFHSLHMGTVKVKDLFFPRHVVNAIALSEAHAYIEAHLKDLPPLRNIERYLGTAGSFVQLAALELEMEHYDPKRLGTTRISLDTLKKWTEVFSHTPLDQLKQLKGMVPERADLMLPACLILSKVFQKFEINEVEVRDRGVRYGKLFTQLPDFVPPLLLR